MSTPHATLATLLNDVLELSLVCKKFLKLLENDDRWLTDMREELVLWPHETADPTTFR
jgi:hypothetical protein